MSPLLPLQEMVLSHVGSSVASQAEGHTHILGSPCSWQSIDHPSPEIGNAPMGFRGEEGRVCGFRRTTPGVPRILWCITGAPHSSGSLLWPFRSRVHALGENPPAGMVHGLCWRHIWESLLLLISAEGAQLRGSLDHTDDQGALQWCQNLFTLSETSAKLTVQLGIDLPWTSTYLRNQLILWNLFKIWQFSKNKSLTGWVSCPRSK